MIYSVLLHSYVHHAFFAARSCSIGGNCLCRSRPVPEKTVPQTGLISVCVDTLNYKVFLLKTGKRQIFIRFLYAEEI